MNPEVTVTLPGWRQAPVVVCRVPGSVLIYALAEPGGAVRYIGQSRQGSVQRRLKGHRERGRGPRATDVGRWVVELEARGDRVELHVVEVVEAEEADAAEQRWITRYRRGGARLLNRPEGKRRSSADRQALRLVAEGALAPLVGDERPRPEFVQQALSFAREALDVEGGGNTSAARPSGRPGA